MSLPWLKDDYKKKTEDKPKSKSRSRSRSSSRNRRPKTDSMRRSNSRSRSRSRSGGPERSRRDSFQKDRANFRRSGPGGRGRGGGGRPKRHRSDSSSSGSKSSRSLSPTRLAVSNRPKYVNSRVFVANIISKEVTKDQLTRHFEKYGNVVDVLIHVKNYAFIQYLKEDHAKLAVEGENGSMFSGTRIDVKMANANRKGTPGYRGGRGGGADRGPKRDRIDPPKDPYAPEPFMRGGERLPPPFPPSMPGDPFYPDPYRRPYPMDPWMDDPYRRDPFPDPYRDPYPAGPRAPPPPVECVVFFVSRALQGYAETIERKIKEQSIIAITAIIPEGRTASQMLDELSSRGGLFAVFVNAQNETHRSLTLNILHGTPQEHRNMPLSDAVTLVGKSFEKYVEELRAKANSGATESASTASAATATPKDGASHAFMPASSQINYLLNLLADKQALTIEELDSVLSYLQERRDKLVAAEKGPLRANETRPPPDRAARSTAYPPESTSYPLPPKRSPERPRDGGYGRRSPPINMARGYPDRGPPPPPPPPSDRAYDERASYDRDHTPPPRRYDDHFQEKEPVVDKSKPIHEELTKKILSIFQGTEPSLAPQSQYSSAPPVTKPTPTPAPAPPPSSASSSASANLINFDNPNVQKALDNLIQSGPNLLKGIAPSTASSSAPTSSTVTSSSAESSRNNGNYGQMSHQNQAQSGQGMMDQHGGPQGMYMDGMQGAMGNASMGAMQGAMGNIAMHMLGAMNAMPPMSMAGPMPSYMGMPSQQDAYGGQRGQPPLPWGPPGGPPPPPPPSHQQY